MDENLFSWQIVHLTIRRARLLKRKAIRETNIWTFRTFVIVTNENKGLNVLLSCEYKQVNPQQTYLFKAFMSSSLYLVKIRSIFSRQPLPLSSTVHESVENALPSLLATASHSSGFSGLCWATSLASASSCRASGQRNGAILNLFFHVEIEEISISENKRNLR